MKQAKLVDLIAYDEERGCAYKDLYSKDVCGAANVKVRLHFWDYTEELDLCSMHCNQPTAMSYVLNTRYWMQYDGAGYVVSTKESQGPWWVEQIAAYI